MALRLRSARTSDAVAIAELHIASWRDAYRGVLSPDFLATSIETEFNTHWQAALTGRRRPGAVVVAMAGRHLAGFTAAWREGVNCHVDNLHVRPGMRNAGIGRALLGFAAQRLQDQGAVSADLWVFAANQGAARFYLSLGAEVEAPVARETYGQTVTERRMYWPSISALIAACAR
ncbi:GNAT family N-acetyltransferase [Roseomonas stagni]|uniref:GNAT family N-acetyltransferase n=1 Tax=Falsiroseomonas algicola TaxID=2716930 RepID=A0A6M1LQ37_9PROT|nr:GNAT family N-acetyltransferase [Falsiroseomonas algicola]NGM22099.1 GNAT family N-acetyltransferase [Falsiroseomonas algicola]